MRLIAMPPGLGDSCWILQKLINANERFVFRIPGAQPQRGKQIFDLLPQISENAYYDNMKFREVKYRNHAAKFIFWKEIKEKEIFLEANSHVEAGKRIEGFLPDLPTSFRLDFDTPKSEWRALGVLGEPCKRIGIYCASYGGSQNWGTWELPQWLQIIDLLNSHYDRPTFVIIGAEYDDLTQELYKKLTKSSYSAINAVGQDLGTTIEILKRLDMFIGFPSGLSIINELCGAKRTFMFYAKQIKQIAGTWGDPERIKSGELKECLFCPPEKAFEWIKNNWAI